jgi:hypothetical protein
MKEYDGCLDFCRKISKQQLQFDNTGMWMSYFKVSAVLGMCMGGGGRQSSEELGKTFCSKIVCEALQYAGVEEVMHRIPGHATPSRLFADIVHSKRRVCASVPYKRDQMLKKKTICLNQHVYFRVPDG